MNVSKVIMMVCDFVGEKEIYSKFAANETLTDAEQNKVDAMVRCFNLVQQEIACDFVPLLAKEEVSGSVINFSSLSKRIIHVFEIKNKFGFNLNFKLFPNFVEVDGVAKKIVYSYMPDDLGLTDEFEIPCGLNERIYAYGVASEFLLIDGLSEDAEIWENRFKESLFIATRKQGEHVLPKRRWL